MLPIGRSTANDSYALMSFITPLNPLEMIIRIGYLLGLLALLCYPSLSVAQTANGSGGFAVQQAPCLLPEERATIFEQLETNRRVLGLDRGEPNRSSMVNDLIFPLQMTSEVNGYYHFQAVSGYVDQDPTAGIEDYFCNENTYNGHKGTDYFTWPFPFYLIEQDLVEVIAAAAGTIIEKRDGNFDLNCSPSGGWNSVYVQHADGSVMWYGHLKNGSLTAKGIGETVEAGEYLGVVASSGNSTGPHLHIEYYDSDDNLLDPYQGACNDLNDNSLWAEQPAYIHPKVNAVLTHSQQPNVLCGVDTEISSFENVFYPNETVYLGIYLTDYQAGFIASTRVYRPNGSEYDAFNTFNNNNNYQWFWNSRSYFLDSDQPLGTWTVECSYRGEVYTHTFELRDESTRVSSPQENGLAVFPNPAQDQLFLSGLDLNQQNYRLVNALGQVVDQGVISANTISLASIKAGLYYLIIQHEGTDIIEKVLKH